MDRLRAAQGTGPALFARPYEGTAYLFSLLITGGVYIAASEFGPTFGMVDTLGAPGWIPTGVALAAVLVLGFRVWPAILVSSFLLSIPTGVVGAGAIALGNTLSLLIGAFLARMTARGRHALEGAEDVFKFILFAGALASILSATIGAFVIVEKDLAGLCGYFTVWMTWWLANVTGVCVAAGVLFMGMEMAKGNLVVDGYPLRFSVFPFVLWAAIRFGQREAATIVFVVGVIASYSTLQWGPPRFASSHSVWLLEAVIVVLAVTTLSVGASIGGRRRAEQALLETLGEMEVKVEERTEALRQSERSLQNLSARLLRLQDEERRRIARELHDSTGQKIAALSMNLSLANREAAALSSKAQQALLDCTTLAEQSVQEMRTLSYLLHPPFLDELGLAAALRWYVAGFSERSGIKVNLDMPEYSRRASGDVETVLFRVVQECLANIHRHSGSAMARIRLSSDASTVKLDVEDNGRGVSIKTLESGEAQNLGVGILGMRERVRQLGGRLEMRSGDAGTVVSVNLPV
jgi:signal transduction histidine kinase